MKFGLLRIGMEFNIDMENVAKHHLLRLFISHISAPFR